MRPSEGRDVRQEIWRTIQPRVLPGDDSVAEVLRVPEDDDRREEVEARHSVVLTFGSAVADFALPSDAQRVFQGMVRLALVQPDLSAALHIGVQQPLNDEQRSFNPPDFA